ncbi:uncharacterized mitochondrial protein AtMg00810-like [Jatropha curcas]|uniref:uncharacterized mitochondrial protein AtMg00810-like n=1 Tax=Jatropha curcas TaxID=180498 RepID=UPI0009D6EEFA|nr:uncharacterized mitochondrial protein AtMg00810-like [Jatropha curcas]
MDSSQSLIADFKESMMKSFEMTDLGLLHYFLGLEVYQTSVGIFISQRKFAIDLPKKFGMSDCKATTTPMNMNEKLQVEDDIGKEDTSRHRSLVGGLIYLTRTRLDIAFSIGIVSRFMHSPTKHHLLGYTDSDWGVCLDDRRSTSGNVFFLRFGLSHRVQRCKNQRLFPRQRQNILLPPPSHVKQYGYEDYLLISVKNRRLR